LIFIHCGRIPTTALTGIPTGHAGRRSEHYATKFAAKNYVTFLCKILLQLCTFCASLLLSWELLNNAVSKGSFLQLCKGFNDC
jgi:hypothetical protein